MAKAPGRLWTRAYLNRLQRAARFRMTGRLSNAEYGAIACDIAFRVRRDASPLASHIRGFVVDGMSVGLHLSGAIAYSERHVANWDDIKTDGEYGPAVQGPLFIQEVARLDPDYKETSWVGFEWNDVQEKLLKAATLKASRLYPSEVRIAEIRSRYPNITSAAATILVILVTTGLSFWVGTCAGRKS